ncbi:MAG TPA: outer membrane protein [Xanthobacteraceae bacterium]|nr:outer membrane protein [Xanthobacteraceae bacterium]
MKKFLLTGAALAVLAVTTPALAADMAVRGPVYKAPPAAPLFNWTGFYLGGHVGYGWGDADGVDTDGWFGGGQIGVNYQFAPNWVWGVEADISGGDINGSAGVSRFKTDTFGTVRARLGYTVDRVMFYGTGGLAWADSKATFAGVSDSQTNVGWALGAGIEYAFAPNWSAKIEYIHADYGSDNYNIAPTTNIDLKTDTVKFGVHYLFNSGGRW